MFKTKKIYIKLRRDEIEGTDLDSGQTISKRALKPFSSTRNIVSNFNNANETIESVLLDLGLRRSFFQPRLKILMHQLEGHEGGLSDIEKRALRDLAEMAGANKVEILEQSEPISIELALANLKEV
jgi:rod shape-determining protein MreB and related proteins